MPKCFYQLLADYPDAAFHKRRKKGNHTSLFGRFPDQNPAELPVVIRNAPLAKDLVRRNIQVDFSEYGNFFPA